MHKSRSLLASTLIVFAAMTLLSGTRQADTGWVLLGWSDLGMNWVDNDFSVFSLMPPGSTLVAQVVDPTGKLVKSGAGVRVTYEAAPGLPGSVNTTSADKINFWIYAAKLFGRAVPSDTGLTGAAMPGRANTPQAMVFEAARNRFLAEGVPLTPYDDSRNVNYFPKFVLVARDPAGAILASTTISVAVSDEMPCGSCHRSGGQRAATPRDGWVFDSNPDRDYKLNILRRHDDRQSESALYASSLAAAGYNSKGLYLTATQDQTPVLCVRCHPSNNGAYAGIAGVSPLTSAMHGFHSTQVDPDTGQLLGQAVGRSACYRCHPGAESRLLRGAMGRAIDPDGNPAMQCVNCHGVLSYLAQANRRGWLDAPNCQSCHTGNNVFNNGQVRYNHAFESLVQPRIGFFAIFGTEANQPSAGLSLYRFSQGHGGLQCAACHGPAHAEGPSGHDGDNAQSIALQGSPGVLAECGVCHRDGRVFITGGPHGMHTVGQPWVRGHMQTTAGRYSECQGCHGVDFKGTVLSRAKADRALDTDFGPVNLWRGHQIGCSTCHFSQNEERRNPNRAPVAANVTAAVASGEAVAVTLPAADADNNALTVRIVSPPRRGQVGLAGTRAVYQASADFEGTDEFTYAAWDGSADSNLGLVTVTVTPRQRPVFTSAGISNAASFAAGGVAPGMLVTIFGAGIGPPALTPLRLLSAGYVRKDLAGTRVFFNGIAAPLVYVSAGQLSAVAPYAIAGSAQVSLVVEYAGIRSQPVTAPVVAAAPGLFTRNSSGKGAVLALNQNFTINSEQDPAPVGSVVVLYATGEGTSNDAIDGKLAVPPLPKPVLPVTARIGGKDAEVLYAGAAPGLVAGVMQVNVAVPRDLPPGRHLLVISCGPAESQGEVTIEVR